MVPTILVRSRLLDRINQPFLAQITLVTAPAGYGKSTLARQWSETFPGRVGYVGLTRSSNSLPRMIQQIQSALSNRTAIDTDGDAELVLDDVLRYMEAFASLDQRMAIILDDYHLIESKDVHDATNIFLNSLPPNVHIIILSRTHPPLSLGRLTAYGHVRQLTKADLGFTTDEVATLTGLSGAEIQQLTDRTAGWIAGIRLAMMSMDLPNEQGDDRASQFPGTFAAQQWLDDYVIEEVLDQLPGELREFVLQSSILEALDPDLCNTVLGIDTSAALIREVERHIALVNRPGKAQAHLTYHRLFAESVGRISELHIAPGERREHHLRAAHWYEDHGQPGNAVEHAIHARAWDQAERLITGICAPLMDMDQKHSVLFWLRKLPASRRRANDQLAYWYAKQLQHTGQFHEADVELKVLLPRWQQSGDPVLKGYAASCEATSAVFNGPDDLALRKWYDTLHYLPLTSTVERLHAWSLVHQLEFRRGNDEVAEQAYRQALLCREKLPRTQNWWTNQVEVERTNHISRRADLVTAEEIYRQQLEHHASWSPGSEARFHYRLASIYLSWNDLDRARAEAGHVERILQHAPVHAWQAEALLVVAQVYRACDEHDLSHQALDRLFSLIKQYGGDGILHRALAWQASCWIADGKIGLAREWAARHPAGDHESARYLGEGDTLTPRIQLLIADGKPKEASKLASIYIAVATREKHWLSLIDLQVWEAVAQGALGHDDAALDALRIALTHGSRGRIIRPFFPAGHDLRPLIAKALPGLPAREAAHARAILANAPDARAESSTAEPPRQPDVSQLLTPSEHRVLRHLSAGRTNREIAGKVFVTERTVKKHVSNILAKLDVDNRTAAVIRAREIGILV